MTFRELKTPILMKSANLTYHIFLIYTLTVPTTPQKCENIPKNHDFRKQCSQNEFQWVRLRNSSISDAVGYLAGYDMSSCMMYCRLMRNCFAFTWNERNGACQLDNNGGFYFAMESPDNDIYQMECCGKFVTSLFPLFSTCVCVNIDDTTDCRLKK
ncbi:hypothetical protein CRM22_011290 [Opisthorchis felineus]|uniref:Apple domain-containing protein n=1 Tax=Opisthorchis felineus TaxID=147828 RepID=A0A4S2JPV7_OPIFE|nr:hypothetical protein CRM22_011290 [Opisthorchis felineus]